MQPDLPCRLLIQSENGGITYQPDCFERISDKSLHYLRAAFGVKVIRSSSQEAPRVTQLTDSVAYRIFAALLALTLCLPITLIGVACAYLSTTHDDFYRFLTQIPLKPPEPVAPPQVSVTTVIAASPAAAPTPPPATAVTPAPAPAPAPAASASPMPQRSAVPAAVKPAIVQPPPVKQAPTILDILLTSSHSKLSELTDHSENNPKIYPRQLAVAGIEYYYKQCASGGMSAKVKSHVFSQLRYVLCLMRVQEFVEFFNAQRMDPELRHQFIQAGLELYRRSGFSIFDVGLTALLDNYFRAMDDDATLIQWLPIICCTDRNYLNHGNGLRWKDPEPLLKIAELMIPQLKTVVTSEALLRIWKSVVGQAVRRLKARQVVDVQADFSVRQQQGLQHVLEVENFSRTALAILERDPEVFFALYLECFRQSTWAVEEPSFPRNLMTSRQIKCVAEKLRQMKDGPLSTKLLLELAEACIAPHFGVELENLSFERLQEKMNQAVVVPQVLGLDPFSWIREICTNTPIFVIEKQLYAYIMFSRIRDILQKVPIYENEATQQRQQLATVLQTVQFCDREIMENMYKLFPRGVEDFKLIVDSTMLAADHAMSLKQADVTTLKSIYNFIEPVMIRLMNANRYEPVKVQKLFKEIFPLYRQCVERRASSSIKSSCFLTATANITSLHTLGIVVDAVAKDRLHLDEQHRKSAISILATGQENVGTIDGTICGPHSELSKEISEQWEGFSREEFVADRQRAILARERLMEVDTGLPKELVGMIIEYIQKEYPAKKRPVAN